MPFVCCQLERVQFKVTGDYQKILRRRCHKFFLDRKIDPKLRLIPSALEQIDFATSLNLTAQKALYLRK